MSPVETINLIRTKTATSPQLDMVTALLRTLSLWALSVLMVSGIIVSGIFYYLRGREQELTNVKQQISATITQNTTKEGLLLTLKQRVSLTGKVLGVQHPVGKVFDMLATFISPGQMSSVSVDDHNKVILTVRAQSIADVVSIADTLVNQAAAKTVRAPQLVSLSLGHTGGVDVTLSFVIVL